MDGVRWNWLYQNGDRRFTPPEALGSTAVLAQDGTVQASRLYPFGEEAQATGAEYKWTNQIRDPNALDHFAFRTYSSNLARWLSPDPAGLAAVSPADPASWNRYAYVENEPLSSVDPLGLFAPGPGPDPFTTDPFFFCGLDGLCGDGFGFAPFAPPDLPGAPGGGVSSKGPPSAKKPQPPAPDPVTARLACAASWAQNHSLAALFGVQNKWWGRALGGNIFASATTTTIALTTPRAPAAAPVAARFAGQATVLAAGGAVGGVVSGAGVVGGVVGASTAGSVVLPGSQLVSLGVTASGEVAAQAAGEASAQAVAQAAGFATGVVAAKALFDLGVFVAGAIRGCQQ